jgi:BMFP domain-containing protein YqiC
MRENQTLVDDMISLGGNILGNLLGARHEIKAHAKQRMGTVLQQLDLVSRGEFDAAFAMLAKARVMQEDLAERLEAIEAHLRMPKATKSGKSMKPNLPSIKKGKRHRSRK